MATKITKLTFAAIGALGLVVSLFAAGALSALQGASSVYNVAPLSASSQSHHITTTSFTTSPFTSTGTQTSNTTSNWAGYVSTGGTYTSISGSWNVPTITAGNETMAADATWVGIGDSGAQALTMDNSSGQVLTATSGIDSNGSSFTVARTSADGEGNNSFGQYGVTAGGGWDGQRPNRGARGFGRTHIYFRYF